MKKAQIIGQVFVFIIAAILFTLVLLYGYKAIGTFGEQRKEIALIEFQDDLRAAISKVAVDYGSVKKFTMNVPSDFEEICFIDLDKIRGTGGQGGIGVKAFLANSHPLIANEINGGTSQNVFLDPFPDQPLRIPRISVGGPNEDQGFLCLPNTRVGILLKLSGLGNKAKIELWPQ